ncbi:glycosyl transferase family 25 [Rhodobacterales bacterium HKCCE2091]|nr:glycosyl transferase family 25 [Rhodobacterales bacterium HKCCE2091]
MRAYVINLASARDRMAFMARQLDLLGLDWERVEAVTPQTLDPGPEAPVWQRWQRPLRVTEMALCASHMACWRRILADDRPGLVLEDDALLSVDISQSLKHISVLRGIDHVSIETRSRKKLVSRSAHPDAPIRRLWQDRTGSAAYVAFPEGAARMLARAERAAAPSDALISATRDQRSYQSDPALAIQLDQCAAYGIAPPMETVSLIDAVAKPRADGGGAAFRMRRIGAQVGMGVRRLAHLVDAERVHIEPSPGIAETAAALRSSRG